MKILNKDINKTLTGLRILAEKDITFDLALEIADVIKPINHIAEVYNATLKKTYERYARKNDDGSFIDEQGEKLPQGRYSFDMENVELLQTEIDALDATENELSNIKKIDLKPHRKKLSTVDIKPAALVDIFDIIEV